MEEGLDAALESPWSVEKRFRVTEVFLAVLWVWMCCFLLVDTWCRLEGRCIMELRINDLYHIELSLI